jgi:transposase InsO family protein
MEEHNLLVKPNLRLRTKRDNQLNRSKPRASRPNEYWGTDMTKVMIPAFGWLYLVIVLDWYTKKIVGYSLSSHSKTDDWLNALNSACNNQFPEGVLSKQDKLDLISDNGSQPTSKRYMDACSVLEIKQIFTSYNNPKGNVDTERVIRTLKEDSVWTREFSSPFVYGEL